MHWRIFYFMWLRRIYEFFCVHSNPIWKGQNCRDYRPSHLTFRGYFRPFWFSRSYVVVAYCNRRIRSSNVPALSVRCERCTKNKKKKITLRCIVIGTCAVQFLHYIPLYRNTQHYATLNCSAKRVYAPEARKFKLRVFRTEKKGTFIFGKAIAKFELFWQICLHGNRISRLIDVSIILIHGIA